MKLRRVVMKLKRKFLMSKDGAMKKLSAKANKSCSKSKKVLLNSVINFPARCSKIF